MLQFTMSVPGRTNRCPGKPGAAHNVIASPGTRTTGDGAQSYALARPRRGGPTPPGLPASGKGAYGPPARHRAWNERGRQDHRHHRGETVAGLSERTI